MTQRILTALVLLPVLLLVLAFGGEAGIAILASLAALFGMREFLKLIPTEEARHGEDVFSIAWAALVPLSFLCHVTMLPGAVLALGCVILFVLILKGGSPDAQGVLRLGRGLAGWLYVAVFIGHAVVVRRFGVEPLFFLLAIVMVGDSAAYFVGTALGRHKLAPTVSPNKSIEGSVGGFVFAVAAGALLSALVDLPHPPLLGAMIGGGVNVAAQLGDLLESFLKRGAGVKDSGELFPGHGGMLDRIDAFLPALPVYAFILNVLGGP